MSARNHFSNPVGTCAAAGALLIASAAAAQAPVRYDAGTISGLPARNIGSAAMSGRIAALTAVDDGGRLTVYVGSASGGVSGRFNTTSTGCAPSSHAAPGSGCGRRYR